MKRGKVLPSEYIIGIIIFTFFIVGGVSMMSEFSKQDATFTQDNKFTEFNKSFNVMSNVEDNVDSLQEDIENNEPEWGVFGALNALIKSSWNSLQLIFNSFSFMNSVFSGLGTVFGLPTWVGSLIILLITVMIVFAIWGAIFQRDL
jgi:hypothetical protein